MDKILIQELATRCIIGTNPGERVKKQKVTLDITLELDLSKPASSDNLDHTVNYKKLKKRILAHIEKSRCFLIEKLAKQVCDICLEEKKVKRVTVRLHKPGALRYAKNVAVELTRP